MEFIACEMAWKWWLNMYLKSSTGVYELAMMLPVDASPIQQCFPFLPADFVKLCRIVS
jgi:hypothetical protein